MSGELIALSYNVQDVGKIMKSSKKRHQWNFNFKGKKFMLCVFESLKTGKFRVELNNKLIYEVVGGKRSISKKVQDPRVGQLTIELMKITNNKYRLSVNNNTFEINNSNIHKMFNYETFEEKQKQIQKKNNSKKEEEYFGINNRNEQKQTGQKKISFNSKNIFGDFKAKAKQGGIGKINLGFNKNEDKKNLLKFDQGIYGKNGKFDEKNFFGNKNNKSKPKKDLFGDDFFKKSKNKKNDFEDFDMFGNQQKPKKPANTGFDDFGFGEKSSKPQSKPTGSNTQSNWDEFDIFGDNKAKPQPASSNMFQNNNASSSSRPNKFGSHFGNDKKDDFDIFGDASSSKNNQAKNDLFDLNVGSNTQKQQPNPQPKNTSNNNQNFLDLDFDISPAPVPNVAPVNPPEPQSKKEPNNFLDFGNEFDLVSQPLQKKVTPIQPQTEEIPEKILTDSLSPNNQQFQENRNQKPSNDIFDMDDNRKEEFGSDKMGGFTNTNGAEISKIDIQQNDISQNLTNMDILDSSGMKTPVNNQFDFDKKKPDIEDFAQDNQLGDLEFDVTPIQKPSKNDVEFGFEVNSVEKTPQNNNNDLDFGFDDNDAVEQRKPEPVKNEAGFDDIFDQNDDVFGESEKKKSDVKAVNKNSSESDHDDAEEDEDDDDDDDEYEAGMVYQNAIYNNDDDEEDDEDEEGYETYKKEEASKKNLENEFL
jgi:hypothetical protein